jgi:Carboxypeptidase regulatory-like domain
MRSRTSAVRWKLVVMIVGLGVFGGSPAAGQQDLTASIIGQVTDQSGAVLPGVMVTATSPALQRQVTSVTNERGEYRLAPLPVGLYEVAFDLVAFDRRSARRCG